MDLPPVPKFDATDAVLRALAELDALASVDADDLVDELEGQGFQIVPLAQVGPTGRD